MTNTTGVSNPFDISDLLTREQRLERLNRLFTEHASDKQVAVLSERELMVVAELIGEMIAITNPDDTDTDGWATLANRIASRIHSRLGI